MSASHKLSSKKDAFTKEPVRKKFSMDDFEVIEKIGKGAFGDVFLVQEKRTHFVCIIKRIFKSKISSPKMQ